MTAASAFSVSTKPDHDDHGVRSKVIVVEHDKDLVGRLKQFIDHSRLVGYQASENTVPGILDRNIDLGAIFLPATDGRGASNRELALAIHRSRPELPIFMRADSPGAIDGLCKSLGSAVAGVYVEGELSRLTELVDKFLFNRHYPNEFVAGVKEFTLSAFRAAFRGMEVSVETPYIVRDKIIYGELFSLLPLEASWCRGYMMLQSEEEGVRAAIAAHKTQLSAREPGFRHVNELLAELANMIWGGFKSRYGSTANNAPARVRVEVPTIINHARRFISFGADDPQLCFKFTLTDPGGALSPIVMYEKFIFSLDWSPENYAESNQSVSELVSSGELEMF